KTGNTSAAAGCVLLAAWHRASGRRTLIIAAVFGQPGALSTSLANALAAGRQLVLAVDHALDHPARATAALAGRLHLLRGDALAGVRVEEVQRGQVHRDLGGLALLDRGPGVHRGHEQDLPQRLGRSGARGPDRRAARALAHGTVHLDLGAEFLAELHGQLDDRLRVRVVQQRRVLEVLRADAQDQVPAQVAVQRRAGGHDLRRHPEPVPAEHRVSPAVAAFQPGLE